MHRSEAAAIFRDQAKQRILLTDGAFGTMIQSYKLQEADYRGDLDLPCDQKGNNDLLVLTQPQIIREIHRKYLAAGADIVETNTFNSQTISLADYRMEELAYELNYEAARLARIETEAASTPERPRFVAGALGPTNRTASISPDVNDPGKRNISYDELVTAYCEAVRGLIDGGADVLLFETQQDLLIIKAALVAAEPRLFELIRYAGTAYLIWMAIGLWRSGLVQEQAAEPHREAWRIIRKAVLINLLNPKLSLFFLAFLPQFVDQTDPAPLATMATLSLVFMAVTSVVFALYGLGAAAMRHGLVARPHRMRIVNRLLAGGFVLMAGKLALAQR